MTSQVTRPVPGGAAAIEPRTHAELALANDAWESLMRAYSTMMRRFMDDDVWCEVTAREYDVLYTLSKSAQPVRQSELLDAVLLSQPAISRLVDRLVRRGLVVRAAGEDRRIVMLSLSDAGRAVQRKVGKGHGRLVADRLWAALDEDELVQLKELTRKLSEAAG